ncbi:MAG: N-6 DNA methylase [Acidobacteria bacterium]|nr:N-6 DNA methylase [Acidobacteriota bacterium]
MLHALYELLRGFQAAHDASGSRLLRDALDEHPDQVYHALLTVILRLVFLLYAEERDMLPEDETFLRYYSLSGLYERLREDAALFPDTMEQRYGAWAQLLVLFRLIHDGAEAETMRIPRRHGVLFDPDRFPFLESRPSAGARQVGERVEPPLVPDGTIWRALEKLIVLDSERISYRALDVEQIGSVYQAMMGFRLETASGRSVAIKAQKKWAAPTTVDLEALLAEPKEKREKWLQDTTGRKFADSVKKAVRDALTVDDLHAALQAVVDRGATPDLVPCAAMVLQPSEERRRSGSHYTPRSLTEPIVRTTLEPVLARLRGADGRPPQPEQILDLKVCDPAIGSGAFLVEACRQLGDALIEAWNAHGARPEIPPDEDEVVFARRLIAQRCLYGVDRNPVAVDLAKVSLWLVTLARDHSFTFLDHALRHGDSLVGLSRRQIEALHWDESKQPVLKGFGIRESLDAVRDLRRRIREAGENVTSWELRDLWDAAQFELGKVRLFGDLALAAFFEEEKPKDREAKRTEYLQNVMNREAGQHRDRLEQLRLAEQPLVPFHWEIEFPEVFDRENPGFDAIIGNPPFGGKNTVAAANVAGYPDWLKQVHEESHGNSDLVAHFFRRAFSLIRHGGSFGLIATNTIAQGDTRTTGLRWICKHGGEIFAAKKRYKWPGLAAVVVSVLHIMKGSHPGLRYLDERKIDAITAFLFHRGGHDDPARLAANAGKSFQGSIVLGMGFTFDDTDTKAVATPLAEMHRLIEKDPRNQEVIFPYIGGEEVNTSPTHAYHRYVINFGERSEEECRRRWPDLMAIVEARVKPERISLPPKNNWNRDVARRWWQFGADRRELRAAIAGLERVLVVNCGATPHLSIAFQLSDRVFAHTLTVFPFNTNAAFCALQSRPHEIWARFFGSTLEDRLRYTPSDCFETFPFPENWETHPALEAAGKAYYEFRAALMIRNNEGLTKTYNRFHDPDERDPDILKLRELHAAMDRAVLDAYGWTDIPTGCEFLLDYDIDEEEWGDRKKPWRYRWPDEVRDEVLARLLELNARREQEEALLGADGTKIGRRKPISPRARNKHESGGLFS